MPEIREHVDNGPSCT